MAKDLESMLNNARNLMTEDFNKRVNSFAASNSGRISPDDYGASDNYIPQQQSYSSTGRMAYDTTPITVAPKNSMLPPEIIQEMMSNPIDTVSELDKITLPPVKKPARNEVQRQQIREDIRFNTAPISSSNPIDYSLLKTIIDESVKRNLLEMKNAQLNESTTSSLKTMKLGNGNKLSFLDSKGNLYEATLVFKRNINDNKK